MALHRPWTHFVKADYIVPVLKCIAPSFQLCSFHVYPLFDSAAAHCQETNPALQALASTMSTGPIAPADGIRKSACCSIPNSHRGIVSGLCSPPVFVSVVVDWQDYMIVLTVTV